MYLVAFFFPPLAVWMCGKPVQALLALVLSCLGLLPGSLYAIIIVADHKADERNNKLVRAIRGSRRRQALPPPEAPASPDNPFDFS
jgi:uncharacterized membrane protein YqaE (UPF0057 family)